MPPVCEECGNRALVAVVRDGAEYFECELCGALAGEDSVVLAAQLRREARERGYDPIVYPLVDTLERVVGLRVTRASAGVPAQRTWPFVQMRGVDERTMHAVENLVKSLSLGAAGSGGMHWVVEVEYQAHLTFTLKPRFHRDPDRIDAAMVEHAQRDLERLRANIERHAHLSWWRR